MHCCCTAVEPLLRRCCTSVAPQMTRLLAGDYVDNTYTKSIFIYTYIYKYGAGGGGIPGREAVVGGMPPVPCQWCPALATRWSGTYPRFRPPRGPARPDDRPDPEVSSFLRKTSAQPKIFFWKRGLKVIFLIEDTFGGNVLCAMQICIFWI